MLDYNSQTYYYKQIFEFYASTLDADEFGRSGNNITSFNDSVLNVQFPLKSIPEPISPFKFLKLQCKIYVFFVVFFEVYKGLYRTIGKLLLTVEEQLNHPFIILSL